MTIHKLGVTTMVIATIHIVIGLILFQTQWLTLINSGWFNSIEQQFPLATVFWFIWFGLALFMTGWNWILPNAQVTTAQLISWWVICLLGALAMPLSGFWLPLILFSWAIKKIKMNNSSE